MMGNGGCQARGGSEVFAVIFAFDVLLQERSLKPAFFLPSQQLAFRVQLIN
jgi:hypothetical protein